MQLEIYYNSTLLKTTLKSAITIKEIIQNAKSKLNTQKNFLFSTTNSKFYPKTKKFLQSKKQPSNFF